MMMNKLTKDKQKINRRLAASFISDRSSPMSYKHLYGINVYGYDTKACSQIRYELLFHTKVIDCC